MLTALYFYTNVYNICTCLIYNINFNLLIKLLKYHLIIYNLLRDATSTTFLQQFYNKSQVVSCYWFKFETNPKITFLP